ncbi:right-handed parallel beta-helix repeat-containing protein [Pedobacter gandavensis]|uniref:right-handed parallel beta-helix repeat-containing protein n=1 Tax=Pedobacter gandavensis TaxID=2679963 RepID=UPI00292F157F|nr:right-handed parallel beta-helix repeat-containing protein [Pedobacter gandavensis]
MKPKLLILFLFCIKISFAQDIHVKQFGVEPNTFADVTAGVAKAIEACRNQPNSRIVFPKGRYDFWPDQAQENIYFISNTSTVEEYASKKIKAGLLLKGLKNITIEGNNSSFVFHGKMATWILDHSENIRIQNLSFDYERPGMSEMTIKEINPNGVLVEVHPDSKFDIIDGRLEWYGEKWVSKNFHAILLNPETGVTTYSSWDPFLKSTASMVAPRTVKFMGDFSKFKAKPGEVLTVRDRFRDYVGAFNNRSKNISLSNVHMNFMHGLGIISQFSENLHYDSLFVEPAKGSGRVIASSADGTHFSGCKGQILIENSRFRGLHDDAINVHGTHLKVIEVLSGNQLRLRFMHGQTYGFEAFAPGDSIALLRSKSLQIFENGVVKSVKLINEKEVLVVLTSSVSSALKSGDFVENVTWTPSLTIRNSRFEGSNARGILVTTRRKVLIENNVFFRLGMHAILIENDALGWFESGPVTDVTISNNEFEDCGYNSYPDNYVINIFPQNRELVPGYWVHKNIRIMNNTFKVYDDPILAARSTNGLIFKGNKVIQTNFMKRGDKRPAILLTADTKVILKDNDFGSEKSPLVLLRDMKKTDIKSDLKFEIR